MLISFLTPFLYLSFAYFEPRVSLDHLENFFLICTFLVVIYFNLVSVIPSNYTSQRFLTACSLLMVPLVFHTCNLIYIFYNFKRFGAGVSDCTQTTTCMKYPNKV